MRFVDLDVLCEDESPSSFIPILVHLDARGGRRTTSKVCCMFIHRSLQEKKNRAVVALFQCKLGVPSEVERE